MQETLFNTHVTNATVLHNATVLKWAVAAADAKQGTNSAIQASKLDAKLI